MKSTLLLCLALLCTRCLWSQLSTAEVRWLTRHTAELGAENHRDFSALDNALQGRRIVALGESSHGLGACYALKSEMVMHLHRDLGYEVLAMEGGLGDVNLAWHDAAKLTAAELQKNTVFGNFRAKEVQPLFDYLVSQQASAKPLHFTGFDSQVSSDYFYLRLMEVVKHYDPSLADSIPSHYSHYGFWFQFGMQNDSVMYEYHRDVFIAHALAFRQVLVEHHQELTEQQLLSEREHQVMLRALDGLARCVDLPYGERYRGVGLRDQIMADNLHWLIDSVYAGKKVLIWAHNAHVERAGITNGYFKWMGHFLAEWYGESYYSLGIYVLKGNVYQHWTHESMPFDHSSGDCLESRLSQVGRTTCFLPLSNVEPSKHNAWLWKEVGAHEPENGGVVNFVPSRRFDGILLIWHSDIPTY